MKLGDIETNSKEGWVRIGEHLIIEKDPEKVRIFEKGFKLGDQYRVRELRKALNLGI